MNIEEIKRLFPLEGEVTQDIIDSANVWNSLNCIGTKTLRQAIGEDKLKGFGIVWGVRDGTVYINGEGGYMKFCVTTENGVNMMDVIEPIKVIFKLGSRI